MTPLGVLDALTQTAHWLGWTRFFGPISGHDAKLDDPLARYLATGLTSATSRRRTSGALSGHWINQRHVTEEDL